MNHALLNTAWIDNARNTDRTFNNYGQGTSSFTETGRTEYHLLSDVKIFFF